MELGERGKVAVVVGVGSTQGLGAALARRFAGEGLHTFVAGRRGESRPGGLQRRKQSIQLAS
jgi:NAD(P)-dependent dehydrogenase (short-subunit alcohol dehydrogenase family)